MLSDENAVLGNVLMKNNIWNFLGPRPADKTASIPTRYQIVVKNNTDKKGFSSQTKRFISEDVQVNMRPSKTQRISITFLKR